jgi:hypothetical protein
MIVGLAVAIGISVNMKSTRVEKYKINTSARAEMVYMPWVGIDKFWADIKWMQVINDLGSLKDKMDEKKANYFYQQFNTITNLDPDFASVYADGAANIAYQDLDKALALIERGKAKAVKADWRWPHQAAHWIIQIKVNPEKDEAKQKQYRQEAIDYLQEAVSLNAPWYVENMLLHNTAKLQGKYGDEYLELEAWSEYYEKRSNELRGAAGDAGGPEGAGAVDPGFGFDGQDSVLSRLRERIIQRCRSIMPDLLAKNEVDKQKVVRAIFRKVNPEGHYAPKSLAAYAPGDLFDPLLADTPITPYGIDLYDYEMNGRIVTLKGPFNTVTGKPVAETFKELAEMMQKDGKSIQRLAAHHPDKTEPK